VTGDPVGERIGRLLGRPPRRYAATPLPHNAGNTVTASIDRYAGEDWSLVRKHLTPRGTGRAHWTGSAEPAHWNYWRREACAYETGLAGSAYSGSGIAAPALLAADDQPDGSVVLWLEDVSGTPGERWDVARVALAAYQLGAGQGRYLAGIPLPAVGWLSRRWLRQYVDSKPVTGHLLHDDAAWQPVPIRRAYAGLRDGLVRLWDERADLLDLVEALPQTLCHLDMWPKNLVARDRQTVLLDWSFVGIGAVGEDAGNLVPDCVWDGWLPASALPELADRAWEAYLRGLRDAGWRGDETLARLGFTAGGAVKYAWLAEWSLRKVAAGELSAYGGYSTRDPDELLDTYAAAFRVLLGWADESRRLSRAVRRTLRR
jgi:hypothetical protein